MAANYQLKYEQFSDAVSSVSTETESVVISWYDNELLESIGVEMDQLYQNLYSSYAQFGVSGDINNVGTYVARTNDKKALAIFVFRKVKDKVQVINSVIKISEEEIHRFAKNVFATFRSVNIISFHAVQTELHTLSVPHHKINFSEDIVVPLPDTVQEYLDSLGKNTKKNVKYYSNKLKRNFPSFEYKVYEKEDVDERHIMDIIKIKNTRMADNSKSMTIDEKEIQRIIQLVRLCGFVGVATIDGRVCAGSIGYRIGENAFGGVIAHDLSYDDYWIGMLCCYLTICASIDMGCKEYHFLWGRDEYKYRWLGVQRDLDNLTVYRSWTQLTLHCGTVLRAAIQGYKRQTKLWLLDPENKKKRLSRFVIKIREHIQKFKRLRLDRENV
jgi:hypothetical protein